MVQTAHFKKRRKKSWRKYLKDLSRFIEDVNENMKPEEIISHLKDLEGKLSSEEKLVLLKELHEIINSMNASIEELLNRKP